MAIALSYSRLSDYESCPRKFKAKYITKTYPDDSDNPYFIRGSRVHKELELAVAHLSGKMENIDIDALPESLQTVEVKAALPIIKSIVSNSTEIYTEQQISVDSNFRKVDWFSKSSYYRAIFDLTAINGSSALLVDWKTGKVREYDAKPTGQLHLSAGILMSIKPSVEVVTCAYMFVDQKQTIKQEFTRDNLQSIIEPFVEAYETVNSDTEFEPKANEHCFFCNINPEECEVKRKKSNRSL